ncbi:MAG: malonyl-ACP O-methyltransferase BioC [Porphyromonadaceae bacterium]|nr:malonyl-ACP O-methyltransferase BioC [Porphyromonadaceae bacterium]
MGVETKTTPLIDKAIVGKRFSASAASYDRYAVAQKHIYQRLGALLETLGQKCFDRVLEIGCGTAGLSKYVDNLCQVQHWTLNDLGSCMLEHGDFRPRYASPPELIMGDAEQIDLGTGYDLIISASAIQWFHDGEAFVRSLHDRLRPGGTLLLSTFGPQNLIEIKTLTGQGLHYHSLTEVAHWLRDYTEVQLSDEVYPLSFASPREVLVHLKRTGVTATSARSSVWTAERLRAFERAYTEQYGQPEGGVPLTYHPIYIVARRAL